jgi:hypothetical protein
VDRTAAVNTVMVPDEKTVRTPAVDSSLSFYRLLTRSVAKRGVLDRILRF